VRRRLRDSFDALAGMPSLRELLLMDPSPALLRDLRCLPQLLPARMLRLLRIDVDRVSNIEAWPQGWLLPLLELVPGLQRVEMPLASSYERDRTVLSTWKEDVLALRRRGVLVANTNHLD
jgi:hypothetical protein